MSAVKQPLISRPAGPISGDCQVPGDKSISHRALILGASAVGRTQVHGLLEADDVLATAEALRRLGASIEREGKSWRIDGRGVGGLREPDSVLDLGNSGTGVRLLIGLTATHPFTTFFTGDASLARRPMRRVIEPLTRMGSTFLARSQDRLPLAVTGARMPLPIEYTLPVASAQVKSAILLAALNCPGRTSVIEPMPTRDHTELLFRHFGIEVEVETLSDGGRRIAFDGEPELIGQTIEVPGDLSSAAFPIVAAAIIGGSRLTVRQVGINPLRAGLLQTLLDMGADLRIEPRPGPGEPMADVTIESAPLRGITVPAARAPAMIDEYPILAVAAACASGTSRFEGIAELRVKESDRLAAIADGLAACGVRVETGDDWLSIEGAGRVPPPGGGEVAVRFDHRIAMAFLVLGAACRKAVRVDDGTAITTSFPDFVGLMNSIGAEISAA